MAYEPKKTHDPRVLRALAHPTRGRILDELSAAGPMRAADVGEALGIPANQASFHLRQLAKYGLIEPAPEAARDRRDRVWRLPNERGFSLDVEEISAEPGGKAALTVFQRQQLARAHELVNEVFAFKKEQGVLKAIIDQPLRLTKEEASELMGDLDTLLGGWSERTHGRGDGRRTYIFYTMFQPYPEHVEPS